MEDRKRDEDIPDKKSGEEMQRAKPVQRTGGAREARTPVTHGSRG